MPHTPTTRKSWFPHPERDLHDNPFAEAACAGVDPEIFFPGSHDPITPALEVCGSCPIAKTCLEATLKAEAGDGRRHGIFGGKTAAERHAMTDGTPKRPRPQHDTTKKDNRKAAAA